VFTPLEKTNNNSSGIEVLSSSLVLAGSRSRAQGTETTLWGLKLDRGTVNQELMSTWTRGDQQVTNTTGIYLVSSPMVFLELISFLVLSLCCLLSLN